MQVSPKVWCTPLQPQPQKRGLGEQLSTEVHLKLLRSLGCVPSTQQSQLQEIQDPRLASRTSVCTHTETHKYA